MTNGSQPAPQPRAGRLAWAAPALAVLAGCAWVLGHAFLVDSNTVRICTFVDGNIPHAQRMPVFLFETAYDGYVWNRYAEQLGRDGAWRLRRTDFDNAPAGREVHWNSAFAWYLRGLGEAHSRVTGEPLRNSIFRMSIWANPLLLCAALLAFPLLAARRFGPLSGCALALGMVSAQTFYDGFTPGYPDHHGIIALALLGLLLGLAGAGGGWVRGPDTASTSFLPASAAQARRWMIFSAVSGAAGLWLSAVSTTMVLVAVGAGAMAAMAVASREPARKADAAFHPLLWRTWSAWGASASLVFYVLEYFPQHMGWRLEVNHPLYALAWLGGGWTLAGLGERLAGREPSRLKAEAHGLGGRLLWSLAAVAALPLAILIGGETVYTMRNGFMLRIHDHLEEFLPLARLVASRHVSWLTVLGAFPLLLVPAGAALCSRRTGRGERAALVLPVITVLSLVGLQLFQARWGLQAEVAYLALAAAALPAAWRLLPGRRAWRLGSGLALLGLGLACVWPAATNKLPPAWKQFRQGDRSAIDIPQGIALLHRQVARVLRDAAGGRPVVVLTSPNSACLLAPLGGFRTVGTFYWENLEGLRAAAWMLTARTDEEALRMMRQRGITHVVLMDWGNFTGPLLYSLHPGLPGADPAKTFTARVLRGQIPAGTRRIPFPPTDSPHELARQLGQTVVLLEVLP